VPEGTEKLQGEEESLKFSRLHSMDAEPTPPPPPPPTTTQEGGGAQPSTTTAVAAAAAGEGRITNVGFLASRATTLSLAKLERLTSGSGNR